MFSKRVEPNRDRLVSDRGEVGVQAHVLVLRLDLEQREDDQDEDEVNLLIRIPTN